MFLNNVQIWKELEKASFERIQLHNGTENDGNVIFHSSDVLCKCHNDALKT